MTEVWWDETDHAWFSRCEAHGLLGEHRSREMAEREGRKHQGCGIEEAAGK